MPIQRKYFGQTSFWGKGEILCLSFCQTLRWSYSLWFSTVPVENVISRCSFQCILYIGFIIQRGCDIALEDLNNRTFLCYYLPRFIHLECVLCPFESSIPRWLYQLFFSTTLKSVPQKFDIFGYLHSIGKYIQQKGIKMVYTSIQK